MNRAFANYTVTFIGIVSIRIRVRADTTTREPPRERAPPGEPQAFERFAEPACAVSRGRFRAGVRHCARRRTTSAEASTAARSLFCEKLCYFLLNHVKNCETVPCRVCRHFLQAPPPRRGSTPPGEPRGRPGARPGPPPRPRPGPPWAGRGPRSPPPGRP